MLLGRMYCNMSLQFVKSEVLFFCPDARILNCAKTDQDHDFAESEFVLKLFETFKFYKWTFNSFRDLL